MKNLKKRLKQGETLIGCWLNLGNPLTAEIIGSSGFDWGLIDLEHGAGSESDVLHQLQALEHTQAATLIRIESFERQRIHRMLDLGAEGIMCPRINNAEEALKFAGGLSYPPEGVRGVAKMVRATGFSKNFDSYWKNSKENILGIIQIETPESLNHLDEIAAIDNIDILFIGPADLSMALGIFGQFDNPLFKDAVRATVNSAEKAGKATGILLFNPDDFIKYHEMGIRFIACGSDATFVVNGANEMFKKLNTLRSKATN
ncbi:MAG TPA: aldolase/citrate lyase family protein [Bacteroidales bacterium]|jgi:4-hydroxy-2-oxoheptanedioate aldolase|nr:aldolase/citrate lyase family protein [Bacteroidales bacterium]